MKKVLFVALMAAMTLSLVAQKPARVPAYKGIIERVQPNGDTLQTYLIGDEHKHWMTTADGWLIKENEKGWLVYMTEKKDGSVQATCRKAHNEAQRSKCEKRWLEKKGTKKK